MKSYIYKISNTKTSDIYIGSTIQQIKNRFKTHKSNARIGKKEKLYEYMREHGIDNFLIELLEECDLKNKKELGIKEKKYYDLLKPSLNMIQPKIDIEIKETGKIYRINYIDKNMFYIGSTISDLTFRLTQHKSASINSTTPLYKFMREHDRDNFDINCIEDHIPIDQLIIRENYWINELKPPLNKNTNLCITEQERDRLKYIKNRDKRLQQVNERRILKRDEINTQKREHYHTNKDKIAEKDKQKRIILRTIEISQYDTNPNFTKDTLEKHTVFKLKEIAKNMKLNHSPRLKSLLIEKILNQQANLFN